MLFLFNIYNPIYQIVLSTDSDNSGRGKGTSGPATGNHGNKFESDRGPKPYSFNGKVVIGIGLILAAAAGGTVAAMNVSTSPYIRPTPITEFIGSASSGVAATTTTSVAQKLGDSQQHIDKKFVLIQKDFGWNGTTGGPSIIVNKGDVVQITVINAGRMAHNFGIAIPSDQTINILKQTENIPLPDRIKYISYNTMAAMPCPGCHPLFKEGNIDQFMQPDTQQVTTFIANQAGNFKYFCMVRGHIWLGMVGDLVVQDVNTNSNNYQAASSTVDANGGQKVSAKGE
jgi:uncharacterized cupredoxin-like copper-binding protein